MKLGYSTSAYRAYSLSEAIGHIAGLGYRGIEIVADLPHAWPPVTGADEVGRVRELVTAASLSITNVDARTMNGIGDRRRPCWIESDGALRRRRVEHTLAALRLAKGLGAPSVSTQPGGPMEPGMGYEWAVDTFVAGLVEVLPVAEELGVQLLVEPEPWLLIQDSKQFLMLSERIRSAAFGLSLDVVQLYCMGEPVTETIKRLRPMTRHYHIEDVAEDRAHEPLVPGHGIVDFAAVLRAIESTGYDGWITVELYPYIDDPDAAGAEAKVRLEWAARCARVASYE
jgi:sugar phosphate isomerase/epimerase